MTALATRLAGGMHSRLICGRRVTAIARAVAPLLSSGTLLDVGAGSGAISRQIANLRPDVSPQGVDILARAEPLIPIATFDGVRLPFGSMHFDNVIVVDVLHHCNDPTALLYECARVCRGTLVVKDHFYSNAIERLTLRVMDWVGNAPHGVSLPFKYWTRDGWQKAIEALCGCFAERQRQAGVSGLYLFPFQVLLGRRLQFVSQFVRTAV